MASLTSADDGCTGLAKAGLLVLRMTNAHAFRVWKSCSVDSISFLILSPPQIHLSLMQDRPATKANVTSTELLDFTLARYVRMRFQGMHTTAHSSNSIQWLVERTELNKRSFYSLRFIKIGARLDCGGHANEAKDFNSKDVIECNCAHNTCGVNCEKCCPLYNQRPYKAATYTDANPCEQCEVCELRTPYTRTSYHHFISFPFNFRRRLLHSRNESGRTFARPDQTAYLHFSFFFLLHTFRSVMVTQPNAITIRKWINVV